MRLTERFAIGTVRGDQTLPRLAAVDTVIIACFLSKYRISNAKAFFSPHNVTKAIRRIS